MAREKDLTVIKVFECCDAQNIAKYSSTPVSKFIFPSSAPLIRIGNGAGNHVLLPHDYVSRHHALLIRNTTPGKRNEGMIRDLSSRNGSCSPHENMRLGQLAFKDYAVLFIQPFRLDISLVGEVDDWDRVSFDDHTVGSTAAARPRGAATLNVPGELDALIRAYPERRAILRDLEQHVVRSASRPAILDWLVRSVARSMGAADSVARIVNGKQVFANSNSYISLGSDAQEALLKKKHFVAEQRMMVPLLENKRVRGTELVGDWTLVRAAGSSDPFTENDAKFLTHLAKWVLAVCPEQKVAHQIAPHAAEHWPVDLVGTTEPFRKMMEEITTHAKGTRRILLTGPIGSGKTSIAKTIHKYSGRQGQFQEANAGAQDTLNFGMTIYGGRRSTTAEKSVSGKLDLANNGTMFLDEIGEMPLGSQSEFLKSSGDSSATQLSFERILEPETRTVDVRLISATSKSLDALCAAGKFDPALVSRIKGIEIAVPSLAERADDVLLWAHFFMDTLAAEQGRAPLSLSQEAKQKLAVAQWPSNVRQVRNVIENAYANVMARWLAGLRPSELSLSAIGSAGQAEMPPIPEVVTESKTPGRTPSEPNWLIELIQASDVNIESAVHLKEVMIETPGKASEEAAAVANSRSAEEQRLDHILAVLEDCKGNKGNAAKRLKISPTNLYQALDDWCIPRNHGKPTPQLAPTDILEKERIQQAMEAVGPGRLWGHAPKKLNSYYQVVHRKLSEHGVEIKDAAALRRRLDKLWIPRHFPWTTEMVRCYRRNPDAATQFIERNKILEESRITNTGPAGTIFSD